MYRLQAFPLVRDSDTGEGRAACRFGDEFARTRIVAGAQRLARQARVVLRSADLGDTVVVEEVRGCDTARTSPDGWHNRAVSGPITENLQ